MITNVLVEPCADDEPGELEMRSRFTVFQASDGLSLQPIVVGRYVDRVARRDGRMAFVRRSIQPQLWGDVTAHLWDVPAAAAGVDRALRSRVEQLEAERAVLDLVNRYGATLDDGDEDGFVACFTDDGAFVSTLPNLALDVRGAEALRAYAASHTRAPDRIHKHCVFDSRIDLDVEAGTGRVVSYFARLDLLADGPSIVAFGRYRDRVVRTPAGWRFARREIAIEALRRPS